MTRSDGKGNNTNLCSCGACECVVDLLLCICKTGNGIQPSIFYNVVVVVVVVVVVIVLAAASDEVSLTTTKTTRTTSATTHNTSYNQ